VSLCRAWRLVHGGEVIQDGGKLLDLAEVSGGELVQPFLAVSGEPDAGKAAVAMVVVPFYQPGCLGPGDQLGCAVRAEQQVAGQFADGRAVLPAVALDGEQQLVLGWGQAGRSCLGLGPVQEAAQPGPEGEQVLVVLAGQLAHPLAGRVGGKLSGLHVTSPGRGQLGLPR
jgi:hypothetical protein